MTARVSLAGRPFGGYANAAVLSLDGGAGPVVLSSDHFRALTGRDPRCDDLYELTLTPKGSAAETPRA